ncbi:hypothetical protein Hanom_Chr10g00878191 [Helianthus anomalus]
MFVHFHWIVHKIMNMKFYWLVQVFAGVPESAEKRVETSGFDSRSLSHNSRQTPGTRDQQSLDLRPHDLDSRLNSRPLRSRPMPASLETS